MFDNFDFSILTANQITFVLLLIFLHQIGIFKMIKEGIVTVYRDVKGHSETQPESEKDEKRKRTKTPDLPNGNVAIAKESLAIIRDSQNLVLLDIPHKLDEVIDELYDTKTQIAQLVKAIEILADKITQHYKEHSDVGC